MFIMDGTRPKEIFLKLIFPHQLKLYIPYNRFAFEFGQLSYWDHFIFICIGIPWGSGVGAPDGALGDE